MYVLKVPKARVPGRKMNDRFFDGLAVPYNLSGMTLMGRQRKFDPLKLMSAIWYSELSSTLHFLEGDLIMAVWAKNPFSEKF